MLTKLTANKYGGIIVTIESSAYGTFDYNSGSLYSFNSNLAFTGYTRLENCAEQSNKTSEARELRRRGNHKCPVDRDLHWSKQFIKQPSKTWWSNISH